MVLLLFFFKVKILKKKKSKLGLKLYIKIVKFF